MLLGLNDLTENWFSSRNHCWEIRDTQFNCGPNCPGLQGQPLIGSHETNCFVARHGWAPGPRFKIKMSSYQYRKSHCGDKTVVRSSYLQMGFPILVRRHLYIESGPWQNTRNSMNIGLYTGLSLTRWQLIVEINAESQTKSTLGQMTHCLFHTKPLSQPLQVYC